MLDLAPARLRLDLLAPPTAVCVETWPHQVEDFRVVRTDPEVADTAAFCERYGVTMDQSANCVIIAGKRGEEIRYAACIVLATTRADVNKTVKRLLDVRKASFAPMDDAVELTGMEFGGITPFGLPRHWPVYVDSRVVDVREAVVGSGIRASKMIVPGSTIVQLLSAEVIEGLAT